MKIFKNKKKLINEISKVKSIAFVPTMGSLHEGHLSLIDKAKKESKNVLVSIFINPKQFNSKIDFINYPRNITRDIKILKKNKVKYIYIPTYKDIYSHRIKNKPYIDKFSKLLCGKYRPGHFEGVINVVNRFIEILNPKFICLGLKDFQQLSLMRQHINKNNIKTKVITCPIMRDKKGVVLSSRNFNLNNKQIKIASLIYKYLKKNKHKILSSCIANRKKDVLSDIQEIGTKNIEYLECINLKTLKYNKNKKNKFKIFISYFLGKVRLIDNL